MLLVLWCECHQSVSPSEARLQYFAVVCELY